MLRTSNTPNMYNLKDYRLSKDGQYLWHPTPVNVNMETGRVTEGQQGPPILITPEIMALWKKLTGA